MERNRHDRHHQGTNEASQNNTYTRTSRRLLTEMHMELLPGLSLFLSLLKHTRMGSSHESPAKSFNQTHVTRCRPPLLSDEENF